MMPDDAAYKETLERARTELETLISDESDLESKLIDNRNRQIGLKKTVLSLSSLIGEDREAQTIGLTDAIRGIFKAHTGAFGLSARLLRKKLQESGFQIDSYKNPQAVIHTTLKRLEEQGEIKPDENYARMYHWIVPAISDDDIPF